MTRQEAEQYLKSIYQLAPCGGGLWVETSDIEDALDVATVRGKAYLHNHVVTCSKSGSYKVELA